MWVQYLDLEDPLEEDTASHSSILTWRIPWTEEPGGGGRFQPIGSSRVRHDGSDLAHTQVPMNHKSLAVFRKQNSTSQI